MGNILNKRNSRGQEEIVGFVLIILLVTVIALVFLGFSLRQKKPISQDVEVKNLLSSLMHYTTNCSVYFEPQYSSVQDLLKSCYLQQSCENLQITACQYSSDLLTDIFSSIETEDRPVKAFEFNVRFIGESIEPEEIELLGNRKGICQGNSTSASQLIPLDIGKIQVSLKFCYS